MPCKVGFSAIFGAKSKFRAKFRDRGILGDYPRHIDVLRALDLLELIPVVTLAAVFLT